METKPTTMAVVLTVALLVFATNQVAEGQTDCIAKLADCGQYLNTTVQPDTNCCSSINQVVKTELDCLCKIYNQPGGLGAFGIDVNQALALPRRCGLSSDVSPCKAFAPGSSIVPPPGAPNKKNGVDRSSGIGMPALLLLVSATIFLN